jgi:peptidoglycan/LPS O-acetylase OafA/YrhL
VEGQGKPSRIAHVSALDGARGLAVAGVLLYHGNHLRGGYLGVDFFFTLSGFLITSLLLAEASQTGGVGLGGFWARRARRLLPALGVLMVGIAIYCLAFATKDQLAQIRGDAFATLAYIANWHEIFSHQNYFAQFSAPSPLSHTWSLAIEEQFYVIWPLLFVGVLARWKRCAPKAVLVISLALAAVSSVSMILLSGSGNVSRAYFGTDTRAAAILLGAALAAGLRAYGPITKRNARLSLETVAIVSAVGLAIAWARLDGQSSTLYHGGFLLCGLAATAIIAAAVHPTPGPVARALSFEPLCALGLISYGVYLYHWPIDVALNRQQMGFGGWPLFIFQTSVTLVAAVASYRIIEQPIRHGALTSDQLRKLTPTVAVALVALIVGTTAGATASPNNNAMRFPLRAAAKAFDRSPPGARRVMIAGDSVAYFLGSAFEQITPKQPIGVFNAGIQGCTFPQHITRVRYHNAYGTDLNKKAFACDDVWEAAAVGRFRPDLVFWFVSNPGDFVLYRGTWISTCSSAYASLYERSLEATLKTLASQGAKVVLTTAAYPRYLYADEDHQTDCENRFRRVVAAKTGLQLVDLQGYICPGGKCREKQDGVTLRVDGEHFEGAGGRLVASWLLDQVR